jgi:hypothetical protein
LKNVELTLSGNGFITGLLSLRPRRSRAAVPTDVLAPRELTGL